LTIDPTSLKWPSGGLAHPPPDGAECRTTEFNSAARLLHSTLFE
jgi:hypothetical protein